MRKRLTVKDLKNLKGKKQLVLILVKSVEEALAAEKVGIEMVGTGAPGKYTNPHNHPNFEEVIKLVTIIKPKKSVAIKNTDLLIFFFITTLLYLIQMQKPILSLILNQYF